MIFKKLSQAIALSFVILAASFAAPTKAQQFTITIPDGVVATAQLSGYTALALSSAGAGSLSLYYLYYRAKEKFAYSIDAYSIDDCLKFFLACADTTATMALLPAAVGTYIGATGMYDTGGKAFAMLTNKNKQ